MTSRPYSAYSPFQIYAYLASVGLPASNHPSAEAWLPRDIKLLRRLHTHQISSVPYENLSLHYRLPAESSPPLLQTSTGAHMSLDPAYLYNKFVVPEVPATSTSKSTPKGYYDYGRGRGGYCFQLVTFFRHILRGMGFRAYTAQARIRLRKGPVPGGDYVGPRHAVNIVTLPNGGGRWMVDVSFGGDGPVQPLPLVEGVVTSNIGSQELRLVKEYLPEGTERGDELGEAVIRPWVYQYRNDNDMEWNSYYAFAELEALDPDLEISNFWVCQHATSFQTLEVLVVKFLRRKKGEKGTESQDSEIYGKLMLVDGALKRNTGGKTELVMTCRSEEERIAALKEHFGLELTAEEVEGIMGYQTELGASLAN